MGINFYNQFHNKRRLQKRVITKGNFTYRLILQPINKVLRDKRNLCVLDYGCGVGTLSFYMAKKGNTVTGVDISSDAIVIAQKNARTLEVDNKTSFVSLDEFGKEKKMYDLVVCSEVIEHVKNDRKLLSMLNKTLKKNSKLVLSTPSSNAPLYRLGLANSFDKRVGHLRRYKSNNLVEMVEESGFIVENLIKTEGILRNSLFMFPFMGNFVRFVRGHISDLVTVVDNLLVPVFGESNLIVVAKKK